MLNTKLILIDGITGSGKSTTAQFLANQLERNGIPGKWYHENENNHPLDYEQDIEVFASNAELEEFLDTTPKLWRQFVEQASQSNQVHIIESFLFQDTIRLLFQNNLEIKRIIDFAHEIEEIIRPLNPALIYLYQNDVDNSIRKIWNHRGPAWEKWFIDSDIQTPYVKSSGLTGETGVIKLWSDYQSFTSQLFESYQFKKISIENSAGEWDDYRRLMLEFLDLNFVVENSSLTIEEMKKYCGTYRGQEETLECTVQLLNNHMVCDLIWPDIRILSVAFEDSNLFYLESFPVFMEFRENGNGFIKELILSGGRKKLDGKKLYKV